MGTLCFGLETCHSHSLGAIPPFFFLLLYYVIGHLIIALGTKASLFGGLRKGSLPIGIRDGSLALFASVRLQYLASRATIVLERVALFGPDRAFLPLTLTGDGALSKDDILSLQAGFPALLPPTTTGQAVAYCDRRQFVPSLGADNRLRTVFYLMRLLAQDERAQVEGILVVILLVTPRVQQVDYPFVRKAFELVLHAMPVKAQWHLLNFPPKPAPSTVSSWSSPRTTTTTTSTSSSSSSSAALVKQYKVQDLISSYVQNLVQVGGLNFGTDMHVHFERSEGELLHVLESELHLTRSGIPQTFGGTWNFCECLNWCRKRALQERQEYKWTLLQAAKNKRKQQTKKKQQQQQQRTNDRNSTKSPKRTKSDDDETGTSKSCTGSHATIQQQQQQQSSAQEEEEEERRLSKKRATNVIQSRRKRERKRQEFLALTTESQQLKHEHAMLQAEHERLQSLWTLAQQQIPPQQQNDNGDDNDTTTIHPAVS